MATLSKPDIKTTNTGLSSKTKEKEKGTIEQLQTSPELAIGCKVGRPGSG